jgi:hypothetical protein
MSTTYGATTKHKHPSILVLERKTWAARMAAMPGAAHLFWHTSDPESPRFSISSDRQ